MSDHLDTLRAVDDPAIDLTDLYTFPSPSRPGQLVLVMAVFPLAQPGALFSDAGTYRFRIRPVTIRTEGSGSSFDVGTDEYAIDCTFMALAPDRSGQLVQEGTCMLPNGAAVSFRINDEQGGQIDGARVYAGLRMDPNFLDIPRYTETLGTRRIAFQAKGANSTDGWNVLSIVVEFDVATMFARTPGTLFAVVTETLTAGERPLRLERFGRPEVKNMLLPEYGVDPVNRDIDLRELYNQEDAFKLGPNYVRAYRARLNANLALFDAIDGKIDWPLRPDGTHPLTDLYLADYQIVDVSKPFAEDSYLEIERALLRGRPHGTAGGRSINDDAIDTHFTFMVTGGNGPRISDGVDQAGAPASRIFPYLAPPNPNPPALKLSLFPSRSAAVPDPTR